EWLGPAVEVPVSGRDLMLAVDLSRSMEQTDFIINNRQVDRLTAAKSVAARFIERRVGDRLGLILFGSQAYMQVPLTFDRTTVNTLLDEAQIGLAGTQTAIGDAIGLAVKRLRDQPSSSQVLILMTDGSNTAGEVEPELAARLAADIGLRIHTIGIGADEMLRRSLFGSYRVNPSADLDEVTLAAVAENTGGRYFRARDVDEFEQIYALIDQMEPVQQSGEQFRPRTPLFPWPLGISLALFAGLVVVRQQQLAA
ncbi:MAG: VWA domain-containing protein, partial [Gammaproteobacteria bacterium]|nr:VWA domain-containing protein [Gammaproteobacteria bacterium]